MIRLMTADFCKAHELQAQIIGGAHRRGRSLRDIGRENIMIAQKLLAHSGIPIVSEDTGGDKGREIQYHPHTNELVICKRDNIPAENWYPYQEPAS